MKRVNTQTRFIPLKIDGDKLMPIFKKDGFVKSFKTRKAVEHFCENNHYAYLEEKYTLYK